MPKAVWIKSIINTACVSSPENMVTICCVFVVCEFFYFAFNFAMLHNWATAYLFAHRMVTMVGFTVLSGHLVRNVLVAVVNH